MNTRWQVIRKFLMAIVFLVVLVLVLILFPRTGCWGRVPSAPRTLDKAEIVVKDGDTIFVGGLEVRLIGIDAPEDASEHFRGDQEPHASLARERLEDLLRRAEVVHMAPLPERGLYNRLLAHLFVDGRNVSAIMVREGHAYENVSFYGYQGFPVVGKEILQASREGEDPSFEMPYLFRKRSKEPAE